MGNVLKGGILVLAVLLVCAAEIRAQTAKGTPGQPDKAMAAAPIDLSGVWLSAARRPRTADGKRDVSPDNDQADEFTYMHQPYPLQPWAAEKFKYNVGEDGPYASGRNELNPALNNCSPQGPTIDWQFQAFPFEIIQSPKRVLIIFERNHEVRQIWIDGREHPKDFGHNWMGHSIGHWEGTTLVADTVGLNDLTWLDHAGHVHSDQLHLIERLERPTQDKLVLHITFDDPKTFTTTWTAVKNFQLKPTWELEEEILCEDKFLGHTVPLR
jgi:hypothetical protein